MQVLKYNIDNVSVSIFFNTILRGISTNPVTLIETDFFKKLLDRCTNQPMLGVEINGPSGTGKSSSALYLWKNAYFGNACPISGVLTTMPFSQALVVVINL